MSQEARSAACACGWPESPCLGGPPTCPAYPYEAPSAATTWPVGRQDTPAFGSDHIEELSWIGKPWRRIELMTNRFFWKGEQVDVSRDLTVHVGFRRLGLGFTFSVTKQSVLDYGDEPNA